MVQWSTLNHRAYMDLISNTGYSNFRDPVYNQFAVLTLIIKVLIVCAF
jgi:hypothetical protein